MNIFISWSKEKSHQIALSLKKMILKVFDTKEPPNFFISSEDVSSGARWFETISDNIRNCDMAIIILCHENESSKWLHFESGAVAFRGTRVIVCPFLADNQTLDTNDPLSVFNITKNTRGDLLQLMKTINDLGGYSLGNSHLIAIFDKNYANYKRSISKYMAGQSLTIEPLSHYQFIFPESVKSVVRGSIYIGTPMASLGESLYQENRTMLLGVIETFKSFKEISTIFSPISRIVSTSDFDGKEDSIEIGFSELKKCEYYVLIFLHRCISSVLIEIGYAIALRKKCIIFVKSRSELPFMLERADNRNSNIKIYECKDYADLNKQIRKDEKYIFDFSRSK